MQIFDQKVAPPRPVGQQKSNLFSGLRIDLAALGGRFGPLSSSTRMLERADFLYVMTHLELLVLILRHPTLVRGMPDAKREIVLRRQGFEGMAF
jgi:hypothetical protein